jgi:hypothetical protein
MAHETIAEFTISPLTTWNHKTPLVPPPLNQLAFVADLDG